MYAHATTPTTCSSIQIHHQHFVRSSLCMLLQRNSFVIILLATLFSSFIAIVSCDKLLSTTVASPHAAPTLGVVNVQQRFQRSAIYANTDYSSSFSFATANKDAKNSQSGYLDAYGLRTKYKYKPQQFYILPRTNSHLPTGTAAAGAAGVAGNANAMASLNLITGPREDICKDHCSCVRVKNSFLTINCDFQRNRKLSEVFGTNFKVPHDATSITIKLATYTNFRLEPGFFNNNTVNSLVIEGSYSDREQVEITSDAFRGNNGPYPEIYMLNVFSVIVRTKAFSGNGKFTVRNSNDLILYPDAFENAKINGLFVGIKDLRIGEKAFNSAQAKLRIESSHIDNIYRFEASLREIRFVNCSIGIINGGTFDVITINSIVFESCRIDAIKARAITEKLYSKHVSFTGAIIGSIESEAIYGSGIAELVLTKNKIDTIHDNAIHVTAINATIARNNIKHLGNNWLRVKEWSNIIIEKNQFGVFGRMVLEETKQPVTCRFDGNSITQPLPGSLNITNPYCILREISINIPCRCNLQWLHELSAHDLRSETYCTIDDKLGHCFNSTSFNTLKYLNEVCDETKTTLDCVANMNLKKIDGRFFTPEELERRDQRIPVLLFIVGCVILLMILAGIAVTVACRFCGGTKKYSEGSANQSANTTATPRLNNHLHYFSPEDRHVIAQTLQLMQEKYPDIYNQVNDCTQVMLQQDLSDNKCVKAISEIVNQLNKEKSPAEFVAFNRVLTEHLQPQMPSAPPTDPIYTEPGLAGIDGGFYTSSTIVAVPLEGYEDPHLSDGDCGGQTNLPEHIYAEPNCAQQPLLRNEYASPADRNMDAMDLYTEPINERDVHLVPGTYATPMRNQHQKLPAIPSHLLHKGAGVTTRVQNLPDVLYQSENKNMLSSQQQQEQQQQQLLSSSHNKPLTNVQRIAQDLQNMPKFQLNQLTPPNSHRPRNLHLVAPPLYTAPNISHKAITATTGARLASPEIDDCELDMRGATALSPDASSDHSGGSDETVKMDDVIEYADA